MAQTISVSRARNNFSELINQVYYQGRQFLVAKMGRPMAVLIKVEDLKDLAKKADENRSKRFKELFSIAKKNQDVSLTQVKGDVKQAIQEVRA